VTTRSLFSTRSLFQRLSSIHRRSSAACEVDKPPAMREWHFLHHSVPPHPAAALAEKIVPSCARFRDSLILSLLVILALIFWYWMWGVPGAILAVPMLAITKIVCDRIRMFAPFGHFLEG
jgi:hypothetical protein